MFTTQRGISYAVVFTEAGYHFQDHPVFSSWVYDISIVLKGAAQHLRPPKDAKVGETVAHIVTNFFTHLPTGILTYVCDSSDKRHRQRFHLFEKWFAEKHTSAMPLEKHTGRVSDENLEILNAIVFRQDHPMRSLVLQAYQDLNDTYNQFK